MTVADSIDVNVQGACDPAFAAVREALERNFTEHGEIGSAVCVYHQGKPVVDLWGGHMDAARTRPWREDTMCLFYSITKSTCALCVHILADRGLDAAKTYKINIPANPPMKDFWSIIAYGKESRTFINSPKFTVSSNDDGVKVNDDGSIDLYLGPKPVKGFEANTVITNPDEDAFLMFRLYGAKQQLWERKWKLGDPAFVD